MIPVKHLTVLVVLFGLSLAQNDLPDVDKVLNNVSLPPELDGKIDKETVENLQNKTLSEVKTRCEKNGGPDAYTKAQDASKDLQSCMTNLVNVTAVQAEIEEAKPNGRVDEVFKKYCDKKPLFEGCIKNFTETTKVCLAEKERAHLKTVYNVTRQLAEFICFKEGDRIALFIAEGGQECFQSKQEGISDCFNKTLGVQQDNFNVEAVSDIELSFDEKQCKQLVELQNCMVAVLETCPRPTSANIVESLFKFIRKATPCKGFTDETKKSSSSAYFVATATLLTALITTFIV